MTLLVFDMGQRIVTPPDPQYRRIEAPEQTAAAGKVHAAHEHERQQRQTGIYQEIASARSPLLEHSLVADLMTVPVVCIDQQQTIADALIRMSHDQIRHLPITADRRILALVSERDLLRANDHQLPALAVASHPVYCTCADSPVRQAASLMVQYHIGALPVCDDGGLLSGILTRSDVLRALGKDQRLQLDV